MGEWATSKLRLQALRLFFSGHARVVSLGEFFFYFQPSPLGSLFAGCLSCCLGEERDHRLSCLVGIIGELKTGMDASSSFLSTSRRYSQK